MSGYEESVAVRRIVVLLGDDAKEEEPAAVSFAHAEGRVTHLP
jgi:hypothetical protein